MIKKKYTKFRPKIRSRHPSHSVLRDGVLPLLPFRSVVRLGSSTRLSDAVSLGGSRIECNTIQSVQNSADKLRMKQCFTEAGVKTANWIKASDVYDSDENGIYVSEDSEEVDIAFPIVAKHRFGSRGRGNTLIKSEEELANWTLGKTLSNYILEKFHNYSREYRLHVTKDGCFYTCRKMLKSETPDEQRWYRNDSNSVWMLEENELFDKPVNWDDVVAESVKALTSVGLDIGAVDLRIQSKLDSRDRVREYPEFIVLEINSAPSFGDLTSEKYIQEIPKVLLRKYYDYTESTAQI